MFRLGLRIEVRPSDRPGLAPVGIHHCPEDGIRNRGPPVSSRKQGLVEEPQFSLCWWGVEKKNRWPGRARQMPRAHSPLLLLRPWQLTLSGHLFESLRKEIQSFWRHPSSLDLWVCISISNSVYPSLNPSPSESRSLPLLRSQGSQSSGVAEQVRTPHPEEALCLNE